VAGQDLLGSLQESPIKGSCMLLARSQRTPSEVGKTYAGQAKQVLETVESHLKAGGSTKEHLLKVRTTIEAKLMRPDLLVEVDCIAALS